MRAKVILIAMGGAAALLLPAVYFHFKSDSPAPAPEQQQAAATDNSAPAAENLPPILKRTAQAQEQEVQGNLPVRPFQFSSDPDECKAQLIDLSASDDPSNLKLILSQMENSNPDIRQAALNATIQFNSKDAIPTLQNEMNWATDPEEKVSIKKAIEFLQLPSFGATGDVTQADAAPASN